jgi:catechol 2,3-dioxygenase-like lactoylglutathione lyase family enzyme
MLDHLSIQCADVGASAAFYDAVLAPLGGGRIMDFGDVIGYGIAPQADFWIAPRHTGEGFRESHIAFTAADRATVRAFFDAGWPPGPRFSTLRRCGRNITPTTTALSGAIRTATTSRP